MKIDIPLLFDENAAPGEFTSVEALAEVGAALERAGFNACLVTDHPCPTGRWLDAGGHHAQGPFVILSMLAALTKRLRLQTSILVLPYRNPFGVARDVATLDHFSGGRVTLSLGAGYLKGEFRAMGADFERRNELFDEYLRALRTSLTGEEFTFEGTGYAAEGNRIIPGPAQPHLPIYGGGNSRRAIRRVVELCDGWNPFFTAVGGETASSTAMSSVDHVRSGIAYMQDYCTEVGRQDMPEVVLGGTHAAGENPSNQEIVDRIGVYRELGVSAVTVFARGKSRAEWCDDAERIGAEIIAKAGE